MAPGLKFKTLPKNEGATGLHKSPRRPQPPNLSRVACAMVFRFVGWAVLFGLGRVGLGVGGGNVVCSTRHDDCRLGESVVWVREVVMACGKKEAFDCG